MRLGRQSLRAGAVLGAWLVGVCLCAAGTTNALVRAVGVSGQVHAFCADGSLSAALVSFCEDVRSKLITRLGVDSSWRAPVVVVFRERPAGSTLPMPGDVAALRTSVVSVSGYLRFQVEAETPPPVDVSRFMETMVGLYCSEMANRKLGKVEGGQTIAGVPAWFVRGLTRKLEERPREATLEVLKQSVAGENVPRFRDLTGAGVPPAGSAASALYGAQCEALLEALESEPEGRVKIRKFLLSLKPNENWMTSFRAAFGDRFGDPVVAEKWWSLAMVRVSQMIVAQSYTAAETRRRLSEALVVMVPKRVEEKRPRSSLSTLWPYHGKKPKHVSGMTTLDKVLELCDDPKALPEIVAPTEARLQTLATLAHPLYRNAVRDYIDGIHCLQQQNLTRFQMAMKQASKENRQADRDSEAITNYVGSVEASLFPEDLAKRFGTWFKPGRPGESGKAATTPVKSYMDGVESSMAR